MTFQHPDASDHVIQSVIDEALALGIIELVGMDVSGQPVYRGIPSAARDANERDES